MRKMDTLNWKGSGKIAAMAHIKKYEENEHNKLKK